MAKSLSPQNFFLPVFLLVFVLVLLPLGVFAAGIVPCGGAPTEGSTTPEPPCTFAKLVEMGNNIVKFLLFRAAAPFAVLLFMWAGFLFMFKSSSAGEITKAKGIFWNVVVGFLIALAAFLIIKLLITGLGINTIPSSFNA